MNKLRKNICLRKFEIVLKEIQFIMSLKKRWSMGYIVCHAPESMTSVTRYHSNYEFILMSK